ncbi:DUF2304 domain-containing protein [Arthrobacter sp. 35W]|uniref:DUF2304 domain-containing protein n=1 Tax=Arthrobacter sp. 35W TaxID=1132441 RepID=UPI0004200AB7|nr:DUF2304 domain-containing protein [Arthrobacter sp. 35W]
MSVASTLVFAIVMVLAVLQMLRRGKLREKYTVLWLVVGGLTIILGLFPHLLDWSAALVGVRVPSNLLFALAIVLLVGVGLHVSRELTILEDETRILAEEVSILRSGLEAVQARQNAAEAAFKNVDDEAVRPTNKGRN